MLDWQAIGVGFAFYLIIEGLMPFLNPEGFKKALTIALSSDSSSLRKYGAFAILLGCGLLYWIK